MTNIRIILAKAIRLLKQGHSVLFVTKARLEPVKQIVRHISKYHGYVERVEIRVSIGSTDDATLRFWEPGAPTFGERFEALRYAHQNGFNTSVSAEPYLYTTIDDLINKALPYTTKGIWVGKMNRIISNLKFNGVYHGPVIEAAEAIKALQSDNNIKKMYQKYKSNPDIHWKNSIRKVINKI